MTTIQQGLLIAAIGMGLVFAVIIFLWGLMALMMRVTSRKEKTEELTDSVEKTEAPLVPEMQAAESQRRAAATAVAVEMLITTSQIPPSEKRQGEQRNGISPWQAFHRSRQLQQKNTRG
jgi:sodium pump decarboxylase gamma subunit